MENNPNNWQRYSGEYSSAGGEQPSNQPEQNDSFLDSDYFYHPDNQLPPPSSGNKRRKMLIFLGALALVTAVVIILQTVFHVTEISVQGAKQLTPEQVIELSGVHKGKSTFTVFHESVEKKLSANRYIKSSAVEVHLPGTVVIKVKERTPRAYICHNAFYIVLDGDGMILEEYANITQSMERLVRVEGLNFTYPEIGTILSVRDESAMLGFRELLVEIAVKKLQGIVTEINISDSGNIFLGTADGFSVRLGDRKRIHAKLEATKQMRLALLARGMPGEGTIDVSVPEKPVYIPVSVTSEPAERE